MGLLLIYATISIFFSFLCSILEAVLLSITDTFMQVKEKEGATYISSLRELKKDVDKPLIAILTLNTLAEKEGVFDPSEGQYIKSLMNFNKIEVKDIMTPRSVMFMAAQSTKIKDFFEENQELRFSRIPVFGENRDDIKGYVLKDHILEDIIHDKPAETLADLRREINMVPASMPIPQLFEKMIATKEHIALVVDDYGSAQGLASMEDVIETMLGLEIMDESDNVEDMQQLARKNWQKRSKSLGLETPDKEI